MSYFPEDIPFISKEELRENGIRIPKDATDTNVGNNSEIPNSSDAINRQDAIDALMAAIDDVGILDGADIKVVFDNLPTIQPEKTQLSQEDTTKDAISRQAAIDAAKGVLGDHEISRTMQTALHILPSAQPERKTGHWLLSGERYGVQYYRCSECEEEEEGFNCAYMKYCPNCGARMEGKDDS